MSVKCFVAIQLPEEARQALLWAQERIEHGAPEFYSWTKEETMHLTLYFLGETDEDQLDQVKYALNHLKAEPFSLRVEGLERMPEQNSPRVLAGGIRGDIAQLTKFQQRLSDTLFQIATFKETRRYYPHATIGRIRRGMPSNAKAVKRTLAATQIKPTEMFEVTQIELMAINPDKVGPKYETLETYKLG